MPATAAINDKGHFRRTVVATGNEVLVGGPSPPLAPVSPASLRRAPAGVGLRLQRVQESRTPDIVTNYLESMGNCCGSSSVDAEEQLDYSAGNVAVILDQRSWEQKLEETSELGKTVVIKFSATWCGPCRNMAPVYAELSVKHSALVFVSVDVDELPELVSRFDIRATPTFIFMRDKEEIDKLVGGSQVDLEKKFEQFCQQK